MLGTRLVPFPVFWTFALVSNLAASAASVALLWALGDERLPVGVLFVYQVSGVVGSLAGVAVGARLAVRLGHRRCVAVSSSLAALGVLGAGAAAYSPSGDLTPAQALAVAMLLAVLPFAGGIGGPAWLALVSAWPGTSGPTRQLLRDSVQFQAGRSLGPLVAAALLASTVLAVQVAAVLSAAAGLLVAAVVLALRPGPEDVAESAQRRGWREASSELVRTPAVWGIAALTTSSDAARTYLPRFVREQDLDQVVYSGTVSLLAVSAVVAAAVASRTRAGDRVLSLLGLTATTAALVVWASTPLTAAVGWLAGGVLLGAGVSLAAASLTSALMTGAGPGRQAAAAGTAMAVRTSVGAAGGAAMAILAGLGALACLPFAVLAGVATLAYAARVPTTGRGDHAVADPLSTSP